MELGGKAGQSAFIGNRKQRPPQHHSDRPSSRSFLRSVPRLMPRITAARL
jgi:hypothetical protein